MPDVGPVLRRELVSDRLQLGVVGDLLGRALEHDVETTPASSAISRTATSRCLRGTPPEGSTNSAIAQATGGRSSVLPPGGSRSEVRADRPSADALVSVHRGRLTLDAGRSQRRERRRPARWRSHACCADRRDGPGPSKARASGRGSHRDGPSRAVGLDLASSAYVPKPGSNGRWFDWQTMPGGGVIR